jgi:hypothetical protein
MTQMFRPDWWQDYVTYAPAGVSGAKGGRRQEVVRNLQ